MDCIFCKIKGNIYEDNNFVVVKDINPKAEVHFLIIPKKHIESINHLELEDKGLMGEMMFLAQKISKDKNLEAYNLQINIGRKAGQIIDHIHMHLLSGEKLCPVEKFQ